MSFAMLDQVRALVRQLPPRDRLQLIAEVSQGLIDAVPVATNTLRGDAWAAEWDVLVEESKHLPSLEVDSAKLLSATRR